MTNPIELFQAGELTEAVVAATNAVRLKPMDVKARSLLCELLCFCGEFERADKQLDAALQTDPQTMVGVSLLKHLIRSELSRREVYREGRIPEFLTTPTESQKKRLEALLYLRMGQTGEAARLTHEASELDDEIAGKSMDGLSRSLLTSMIYWDQLWKSTRRPENTIGLDLNRLSISSLAAVEHLSDMLWRAATIETVGEINGRIHVPALYESSEKSTDQRIRIGRATEWVKADDAGPTRGAGQREFLENDDIVSIMQIRKLSFRNTVG